MLRFLLILGVLNASTVFADDTHEEKLEEIGIKIVTDYAMQAKEVELSAALREEKKLRRDIISAQKKYSDLQRAKSQVDAQIARLNKQSTQLNTQLANVRDVATNNRLVGAINSLESQLRLAYQRLEKLEESEEVVHTSISTARNRFVTQVVEMQNLVDSLNGLYETSTPEINNLLEQHNKANNTKVKLSPTTVFLANVRKVEKLASEVLSEEVPLRRDRNTYWVGVQVNGEDVMEMVVDSGASLVSIPYEDALKVGLKPGRGSKEIFLKVADGRVISGHQMTIKEMRVGNFTASDVDCVVLGAEAKNSEPLLGMSFLGKFKFEIDAGKTALVMTSVGDDSDVKHVAPEKAIAIRDTTGIDKPAVMEKPVPKPQQVNIEEIIKNSAKIKVKDSQAIPLEGEVKLVDSGKQFEFEEVPDTFRNKSGTAYFGNIKHNGVCEFEVLESGHLIVGCGYGNQGNSSGGWVETRWLPKDFIANGWQELNEDEIGGPLSKTQKLFTKFVKKDETYSLRCNKYSPPIPVVFENSDFAFGNPTIECKSEDYKLTPAVVGGILWSDKTYRITSLPAEMSAGTWALVGKISKGENPLDEHLVSKNKTQVFVAMRSWTSKNNKTFLSNDDLNSLLTKDWKRVEGFSTTAYEKQKWEWMVVTKQLPAGQIHLPELNALDALKVLYFK